MPFIREPTEYTYSLRFVRSDAIGVNESRVSQLHARAMQRLRSLMAGEPAAQKTLKASKPRFTRPRLAHASPRPRQIAAALPRRTERVPQTRVA